VQACIAGASEDFDQDANVQLLAGYLEPEVYEVRRCSSMPDEGGAIICIWAGQLCNGKQQQVMSACIHDMGSTLTNNLRFHVGALHPFSDLEEQHS
jgi:hypothetical protein